MDVMLISSYEGVPLRHMMLDTFSTRRQNRSAQRVLHVESASPHEVTLVAAAIDSGFTEYAPDRIIGDKACDSDGLDQCLLEERGIEMIAPRRGNRRKSRSQDGRKLRRYKRR